MDVKDKAILISGGANGLGRAMAIALQARGAKVAALDVDAEGLRSLALERPEIVGITCNLTDVKQVEEGVAKAACQIGPISVLINNAGIIRSSPLINVLSKDHRLHSIELWREVISTNLDSVFFTTLQVVNQMTQNRIRGVILNISSVTAKGSAGQSAYAAAKAGVTSLTKTWAKELAPFGIRSVAIAPGFIDTPSTRKALNPKLLEVVSQLACSRRLGEAAEVVSAALFAIENDFFNGKVIELDGGLFY